MSSKTSKLCAAATLAVGLGLSGASPASATPRIVVLGDSITAGYGLPSSAALPAQLQAELIRLGAPGKVVAAGVVGDTTAGGVARVDRAAIGADLCVVALGGNDLLQGVSPERVRSNLDKIVRRLKARGVDVVLAGVQVPLALGGAYARNFNAAFASVATQEKTPFVPDMLAGVALNPQFNQRDGVHPNAAGVQVIARRLAPVVATSLRAR